MKVRTAVRCSGRSAHTSCLSGTDWLTLQPDGERMVLRIRDDGKGIGDAPEGAGLRGMRERAVLVGGTLDLTDALGGGTSVTLTLP